MGRVYGVEGVVTPVREGGRAAARVVAEYSVSRARGSATRRPARNKSGTAADPSAVCEALLRHPDRVLKMSLAGFDKVNALAAAPPVTEGDRHAAQRTFWYHVGSLLRLE